MIHDRGFTPYINFALRQSRHSRAVRSCITGFTLLETLIALFILSSAISGAFAVVIYNVNNASYIKNSFVANGLAQEAMEIVRNMRDNDWLAGRPFGTALPVGSNWRVDWQSSALLAPDTTAVLKKNPTTGLYSYAIADEATVFKRTVDIVQKSPDEYQVNVKVSWREHWTTITPSISAEEHLFNWY